MFSIRDSGGALMPYLISGMLKMSGGNLPRLIVCTMNVFLIQESTLCFIGTVLVLNGINSSVQNEYLCRIALS